MLDWLRRWGHDGYVGKRDKYLHLPNGQVLCVTHSLRSKDVEITYWIDGDDSTFKTVTLTPEKIVTGWDLPANAG